MGLLARVSKLLGTDLSELLDKAEDPERVLKQVLVDMQNQLMQVKTQVVMTSSGLEALRARRDEEQAAADWSRRAQFAVTVNDDLTARTALKGEQKSRHTATVLAEQIKNREAEVDRLKALLRSLGEKMQEARNIAETVDHKRAGKVPAALRSAGYSPEDPARRKEQEIEQMLQDLKSRRKQ